MERAMTRRWLPFLLMPLLLQACAMVSVASTAVSVTAGVVGLAADAAIGTAKIVGKGVGKAADAVLGDDEPARPQAEEQTPAAATQPTETP
jgi:hypothetical protein